MAKKAAKQQAAATSTGVSFFQRNIYVWCIAAFAVVLYANSLFNGYNMDDELVTRNHRLTAKGISALPEIFTSPYYEDNMGYAYEYRPVVLATFAIEHTLFGEHAGVSHFINLLLYIALCIAVFYYVRQLKGVITPFLALVAALIFVAHPSHTEVVSSIKNRDEILGLLFSLLASLTALRAARQGNWWAILLTVLWFALAMLSKSTFVPFAFFIPLSLILFSPATLAYTVVLTLPLAAITYAVLDINPLHLKLWLALALPAAVAAMHILIKGFNPAPLRALFNQPAAENTLPDAPFSGLQAWYSGFNAASLIGLLPVLIILPVYALLCVGTGWALVLGAGVLLSGVVAHVVRFRYWNLSLAFTVAAIIAGIETVGRVDIGRDNSLILEVFYVLLYFQFFWGRASVRLAAVVLVPFVAYYLSSSYLTGDIFDTFLLFLFAHH